VQHKPQDTVGGQPEKIGKQLGISLAAILYSKKRIGEHLQWNALELQRAIYSGMPLNFKGPLKDKDNCESTVFQTKVCSTIPLPGKSNLVKRSL
jgi:hypothetical protein